MQETKSREIGGLTFEVTTESFASGRVLLVLIGKIAGPSLVKLLSGAKSLAEVKAEADLSGAVLAALEQITDARLSEIEAILAKSTRVKFADGRTPFLETCRESAFAGPERWTRYFGWLKFALEVNFGSFFDSLSALVPAPKGAAPRS
jgi:hypothetical protein